MIMAILSLYFPILLSLSISFLLHTFKKHVHYFLHLAIATNNKLCHKRHYPISSSTNEHSNEALNGSSDNIGCVDDDVVVEDGLIMSCTEESIGFESSIEETRVHDDQLNEIDFDDDNDDVNDEGVEEGDGKLKSFPPPLSSLNRNGEQSFALLPIRENGRLQLRKVRVRRPETLHASREDGRLRMYLIPEQCSDDDYDYDYYDYDYDYEEEESELEEEQEQEQELVEEEKEEEKIVESSEEINNEEIRCEYENSKEEHRFEEWKFPTRRCHDVMSRSYSVHIHMCIA